ncbi:unnamed protein product [Tilletia controversa]|nr:unnamed protein product [Tilletia controversa]
MREEHRGLREDNMFLRQQLNERLAVPPMPQHASASQTQTHGHATTMPARPAMTSLSMAGRGGPAAAPAAPAFQAAQRIRAMSSQAGPSSLRVHATSGTSFPTQRHASMKAASTASISVDEPVKVKLHNDRIEISSDEHSDAEPDAEGAEGAGPLSRKIAAVEAKAKKDKKRKLSGTSDSAGKERHAAPSATSKKGCGSTQQQDKVKVDPKNDPKKQICPVCNKKETPEPWSEDETGQGNGKLKSPYHSDCLEVVAQGGLRHEKPRAGKAWRCAVCKLAGLIPKKP